MKERPWRIAATLAISIAALAATLFAATGPLRVTYYYLPG